MDHRDHRDFRSSDPGARASILLLGGEHFEGVAFTRDQMRELKRVYQLQEDENSIPEESRPIMQAGATRNLLRAAKSDGLRLVALLARFCDEGEDPVKVLVRALVDQGCDIGDLAEWAES